MSTIPYDPSDPAQSALLGAIAQGESGGSSIAPNLGAGGTDLSSAARDAFGFPLWGGFKHDGVTSHGAGTYQFEPGTWRSIAARFGLNFESPSDQSAGAWYLAQQVYSQKTGGDLEAALTNGQFQSVQDALNGTWGTTGNVSLPGGLAHALETGADFIGLGGNHATDGGAASGSSGGILSGIASSIQGLFIRGGLLIIGALVILVALWLLLSRSGTVPSPSDVAKAAAI